MKPLCNMLKIVGLVITAALVQGVPISKEDLPVPPPTLYRAPAQKGVVFDSEDKQNPWQKSGQFQGDILLDESISARTGVLDTRYRWPDGVMPYYIDPMYSAAQRAVIEEAIADYNSLTCVTMRPYEEGDPDYIWIRAQGLGCYTWVGRRAGGQDVNLEKDVCTAKKGTVIHELLHVWGFYHMTSATERDDYVEIVWDNIQRGAIHNFDKYNATVISQFGYPYDYSSIMHYDQYAFSDDGEPTIIPLEAGVEIGQNEGFSELDILRLNAMYNCSTAA